MTTKVLIVDPDITFAVGIKRALEQSGDYKVTAFANGQAAVELVRAEPQDVTIIDFNLGDMDIVALIAALRGVQPDLFILVSPRTGVQIERLQSLDVQGSITKPYYARQLGPVIRESVAAKARLARKPKPAVPPAPPPVSPDFDAALAELPGLLNEPPVQPDDTFRRHIAAMLPEKPTTPSGLRKSLESVVLSDTPISEQATIADLVSGKPLVDPPQAPEIPPPTESAPGPQIAVAALDLLDTVPIQDFSLKKFMNQVETQVEKESGQPLPAWTHSSPDELDQPTIVEPAFVEAALANPPPAKPSVAASKAASSTADTGNTDDVEPDAEDKSKLTDQPATPEPVAEMALRLTQLSMQSAARATLLTRDNTPVAVAGELTERAIAGVVDTINQAWQSSTDASSALIRYIQVPGVGDFLLYSTLTADQMRLSMLFPAETPLRIIRKQTRQLIDALEKMPVAAAAAPSTAPAEAGLEQTLMSRPTDLRPPEGLREALPAVPTEAEVAAVPRSEGPYSAYAFVWLPRAGQLAPDRTAMVLSWLDEIAAMHAWQVEGVEVQAAYIAIQVSVPANEMPSTTVETLMSATAARAGDPELWADAYYIVSPGRAVTQQEIANFMGYRREFEK